MYFFKSIISVLITDMFLKTYTCHRRIINGGFMTAEKRYLVYLIPSNLSKSTYDSWLCGGTIVTPTKILTAASCLLETEHIYVIAGLKVYVPWREIDNNECTKRWKQRVVQVFLPKQYLSTQSGIEVPIIFDNIGIAVVEKRYNFSDLTYRLHCSYIPNSIQISFEPNEESIGNFVFMMGWGSDNMRQDDEQNRHYAYTALSRIGTKARCTELANYRHYTPEFIKLIEKHIVCVHGTGIVNPIGDITIAGNTTNQKCSRKRRSSGNTTLSPECVELNELEGDYDFNDNDFRKKIQLRKVNKTAKTILQGDEVKTLNSKLEETRRQGGICQNDHGGPLVTWIGSTETVIGVALTRFPKEEIQCNGPYFFFSTFSVSQLILCLLTDDIEFQKGCTSKAAELGYTIEHKKVNWENKPLLQEERKYKVADVSLRPLKPLRP